MDAEDEYNYNFYLLECKRPSHNVEYLKLTLGTCTPLGIASPNVSLYISLLYKCFRKVPTAGLNGRLLGFCWSATFVMFVEGNLLSATNFKF